MLNPTGKWLPGFIGGTSWVHPCRTQCKTFVDFLWYFYTLKPTEHLKPQGLEDELTFWVSTSWQVLINGVKWAPYKYSRK